MNSFTKIIDISVPLTEKTVVYPGTPPMIFEETRSSSTGSRLTKVSFSTHIGTHIDAPSHVLEDGKPLGGVEFERFVGPCRVVDMTKSRLSISLEDVKKKDPQKGERMLLKTTNSERGLDTFYEDFVFLSSEAAQFLAGQEIALIGIDYFSIKQKGSPDNRPHIEFLSKGIPILEGVNLSNVEPGEYFLSCAPLRFDGLDGSPCRALLFR